jgi:hypothetical protein
MKNRRRSKKARGENRVKSISRNARRRREEGRRGKTRRKERERRGGEKIGLRRTQSCSPPRDEVGRKLRASPQSIFFPGTVLDNMKAWWSFKL